MSLTVISAHDFIFPFKYAQVESAQTLPAKHVYEGWKRAIQSGKNPRTGRDLTPKEVQRLQSKVTDYESKLSSGAIPKEPTPPPAPHKSTPPTPAVPQEPDYTINRDAEPADSESSGHLSTPPPPAPIPAPAPAPAPTPSAASTPQQQPKATISKAQLAKLLHNPDLAKQTVEMYRETHPQFADWLDQTLQKYQWAANPQQQAQEPTPQAPALTPPPAASFQSPGWASPEMGQQMQDMYNQNQKMKQFNDWAVQAKQQGFTDDQINQLRSRMNQPMNQSQMFPYNYQAPQQQAPQRSFWQDVGRGAGFGAGAGGGGGWAAGGPVGMIPGAAAGGLLGGLAGGARNLYNRGKRLYDDYLSLQKNPNQTWNQIRGRTAASSKFIKVAWDDDALDFMSNLNEEDAEAFAYFVNTSQGIVPQPASSYL